MSAGYEILLVNEFGTKPKQPDLSNAHYALAVDP